MSHLVPWIAAVGEPEEFDPVPLREEDSLQGSSPKSEMHGPCGEVPDALEELFELDRRRRAYRGRTTAILRKYMRYSLETGRLPSLIGREFFRSTVTQYRVTTFEDRVIFVHDMENCLQRLDELSRQVIARIVLQEYEHEEAARLLGCTRRSVHRWLIEALDKLSEVLLAAGLLEMLPPPVENSCQGGAEGNFCSSDEEQRK
jgi:predicted DNA-binding protein (UPF0251 family)